MAVDEQRMRPLNITDIDDVDRLRQKAEADKGNLFTGNNNSKVETLRSDHSVNGMDGMISSPSPEDTPKRKKKKEEKSLERFTARAYLYQRIVEVQKDIEAIEGLIDQFEGKMGDIAQQISEVADAIEMGEEAKGIIQSYIEQDKGRLDFIRDHFKDRVFTDEPGNLLEAVNTPITDAEGRVVYQDDNGNLYHLNIDAEAGTYERVYYTEAADIVNFMHQAWDPQTPRLFGNETPAGRDFMNMDWKQLFDIQSNAPKTASTQSSGGKDVATDIEPGEEITADYILTIKPLGEEGNSEDLKSTIKAFAVCDQRTCELIEEKAALTTKYNWASFRKQAMEAELQQKQQELKNLQSGQDIELENPSLEMNPDPVLDKIAQHKGDIIIYVEGSMRDSEMSMQELKDIAQHYGIPESHMDHVIHALDEHFEVSVEGEPLMKAENAPEPEVELVIEDDEPAVAAFAKSAASEYSEAANPLRKKAPEMQDAFSSAVGSPDQTTQPDVVFKIDPAGPGMAA